MMKLYRITIKTYKFQPYVLAEDSEKAYQKVRKFLDVKDLCFSKEREMKCVELLADEDYYSDVEEMVFI